MKIHYLFSLIFVFILFSCQKSSTPNPDTYLFDFNFNINNSFLIETSGELISTNNGYLMDEYIYDNIGTFVSNLFISDGLIPDTLISVCGNYNYLENPTAEIRIWFPFSTLQEGLYTYNKDSAINDFTMSIIRNISFDSTAINNNNQIVSSDIVASTYGSTNIPNGINLAQIKIDNANSVNAELKFVVINNSGEIIKGSYIGNLELFKLKSSSADCD
ncbi:MAG: hypothetical protein CL853_03540 [Crocinitomicaceae bacterium]|nr:hypothetical protein [Crocinitomicaceae bacterium]|tara:strand:+ start:72 stop:722 length:651 start_codon:yes stop_codon:yes gene_type:complete